MSDIQNNDGREEEVARDVQPSTSADALRLRPAPPRVTRLSRKVLAGLGVVAGLGIGGALIFGLQGSRRGDAPAELFTTANQPTADGLRPLPTDSWKLPQRGPALPGHCGQPLPRAREAGRTVPAQPMPAATPATQRGVPATEARGHRE